ncbi:DUF421 domain-containing protein [Peredibacter sp. HCB2-198]|uniref:DUF421 domain-containing protein n=1 Tax=Peredibacter sp. HCB2-198 TaxID=3383025 RepID=UPI0038B49BBB
MWNLDTEWQELIIRATSVFAFLFLVFRFWGKKHFGDLTPFDLILLLIMSEAVQNALVGDDKGIPAAFITIGTMVIINIILNKVSFHFRVAEKVIEGVPKVLIKNGRLNKKLMHQETITDQELHEALRMQGVMDVDEVFQATLEANGSISVVKKKDEPFMKRIFH